MVTFKRLGISWDYSKERGFDQNSTFIIQSFFDPLRKHVIDIDHEELNKIREKLLEEVGPWGIITTTKRENALSVLDINKDNHQDESHQEFILKVIDLLSSPYLPAIKLKDAATFFLANKNLPQEFYNDLAGELILASLIEKDSLEKLLEKMGDSPSEDLRKKVFLAFEGWHAEASPEAVKLGLSYLEEISKDEIKQDEKRILTQVTGWLVQKGHNNLEEKLVHYAKESAQEVMNKTYDNVEFLKLMRSLPELLSERSAKELTFLFEENYSPSKSDADLLSAFEDKLDSKE